MGVRGQDNGKVAGDEDAVVAGMLRVILLEGVNAGDYRLEIPV